MGSSCSPWWAEAVGRPRAVANVRCSEPIRCFAILSERRGGGSGPVACLVFKTSGRRDERRRWVRLPCALATDTFPCRTRVVQHRNVRVPVPASTAICCTGSSRQIRACLFPHAHGAGLPGPEPESRGDSRRIGLPPGHDCLTTNRRLGRARGGSYREFLSPPRGWSSTHRVGARVAEGAIPRRQTMDPSPRCGCQRRSTVDLMTARSRTEASRERGCHTRSHA